MPVYDFNRDVSKVPNNQESIPHGLPKTPGIDQLSHVEGGRTPLDGSDYMSQPSYTQEFITPAFRSLDHAIKLYWSGIRVPTKDSYRFLRLKIAGGDKSVLVWTDDLIGGRARLPVAAISRESHEFNPEKYSPRYHAMTARYLSKRGDQVAKVFRPVPYLVKYEMIIWSEFKRDADYILYQVLTRFNPLAEFKMFDGRIRGNVQLRLEGSTDASDKEVGYDQQAKHRYEVSFTAEAWLPLPEQIVKTVLGRVTTLKEQLGSILATSLGSEWQ